MTITTLSTLDFGRDTDGAREAAAKGPVFITDRGEPVHVLLSIGDYRTLSRGSRNIADLLAMPDAADIDIEVPPRREWAAPADLS